MLYRTAMHLENRKCVLLTAMKLLSSKLLREMNSVKSFFNVSGVYKKKKVKLPQGC